MQVKLNPAGRGDCLVPGISLLSLEPGPHYAYTSLLARTSTHLSTRSTSSWHTGLSVSWDEVQRVWRKERVAETYIVHFRQFCPQILSLLCKNWQNTKGTQFFTVSRFNLWIRKNRQFISTKCVERKLMCQQKFGILPSERPPCPVSDLTRQPVVFITQLGPPLSLSLTINKSANAMVVHL